ncbi:unnamed protein product [Rotaria sordida]|uniref:Hermes trasposase DNA-binding domain-containing protein n=2 Tax=Rotaria sordida TaxID=392033 RepID=A0A815SAP7_9BILA|nr:unnamed protein product [Rotaria sordida]
MKQTTRASMVCIKNQFYDRRQTLDDLTQACAEFSALDGRAFQAMKGNGFQNLAQVLFDAGRSYNNSSIQVQDILPHPTTVRQIKF